MFRAVCPVALATPESAATTGREIRDTIATRDSVAPVDVRIAIEIVVVVDIDVVATPAAAPTPAASPESSHCHAHAESNGCARGIVSIRRIVDGRIGIESRTI